MNDKLVFGQYYHADSVIHKLNPKTKIIFTLLIMICAFFVPTKQHLIHYSFIILGLLGLFIIILILLTKVPILNFIRSLKQVLFLIIFASVFQLLINNENPDLYFGVTVNLTYINIVIVLLILILFFVIRKYLPCKLLIFIGCLILGLYILQYPIIDNALLSYEIKFYQSGLYMSLLLVLRIFVVILTSTILSLTTKPTDLSNGIEELLRPLEKLKIKTSIFAMMMSISLRFIPTLFNETDKILKAQASRGVDFNEGKLKNQIMQIISLLVPMFVISLKRAADLADAMEARGYIPGAPRTKLNQSSLKIRDIIMITLSVIISVSIITISILLNRGIL